MTWLAPPDGRPAVFSDAAIQFCLTIKVLFKLPLRQTTGMEMERQSCFQGEGRVGGYWAVSEPATPFDLHPNQIKQ